MRESTIWVVFTSQNGAAIPFCYHVSQLDAHYIVVALNAATQLRMLGVVFGGVVKPRAPKRKDLAINPTSRGCTLIVNRGDAAIKLDDATRTVTWGVPENNHAVECARNSTLGRALFTALARIDWKRGSGGTLVGNDEYNRDSDYEDGAANYVTARYGVAS